MGKVEHTIADVLIPEAADRNANRLRVYRKGNGEVVINFRNFKVMIFPHEIEEVKRGFADAKKKLDTEKLMENDL